MQNYICLKCDYKWQKSNRNPIADTKPKQCPKCKSTTWSKKHSFICVVCKSKHLDKSALQRHTTVKHEDFKI